MDANTPAPANPYLLPLGDTRKEAARARIEIPAPEPRKVGTLRQELERIERRLQQQRRAA